MPLERTNNRKGKEGRRVVGKLSGHLDQPLKSPRTLSSVFPLLLGERVEGKGEDTSVQVIVASWWAVCLAIWALLNQITLMWAGRDHGENWRLKYEKTVEVGILWWSWLCHQGAFSWLLRFPPETLPHPSLPHCPARLSCYGIDVLYV